jgi:hypothetical protein
VIENDCSDAELGFQNCREIGSETVFAFFH